MLSDWTIAVVDKQPEASQLTVKLSHLKGNYFYRTFSLPPNGSIVWLDNAIRRAIINIETQTTNKSILDVLAIGPYTVSPPPELPPPPPPPAPTAEEIALSALRAKVAKVRRLINVCIPNEDLDLSTLRTEIAVELKVHPEWLEEL